MRFDIGKLITDRAEREKKLLAAGERPAPRLKNRVQRTAAKLLATFFALMLVFTLVARVASAATVANVETDTAKSGVLTDRAEINGQIEAEGDVSVSLPEGLRIEAVYAKVGKRVSEGDDLLGVDPGELAEKLEKLEGEIRVLELKIESASSGISGSAAEAVLAAQQALSDAQNEYERLVEKLDRSEARSEEDFKEIEAALEKAKSEYEKTLKKTREDILKAAEDKLKEAKENLETSQESADDAIRAAKQALNQAADSSSASDAAYQRALTAYNSAKSALETAQQALSDLESQSPQNPDAIAEAKEAVSAAQAAFDQASENLAASNYSDSGYSNANENLKTIKERWEKNIQKAKDAVAEAEAELEKERARTDYSDEAAVIAAQSALDSAERDLKSARRTLEDGEYSREDELYSAKRAIESAQRSLESAQRQASQEGRSDAVSAAQAEIDRLTYQNELRELEKQMDLLKAAAENGGIIPAPADGTILETLKKGDRTKPDTDAVTISRSDQGFTFTGSLDSKTAAKLQAGDKGTLSYTHEGKSRMAEVKIASIGVPNEEGLVEITAELPDGSYPSGVSARLTVTRRSETHYSCLPLSALRSGSKGDYVLVLREKKTVMGTELTVVEVPVTVKDRDSELMSIESSLMWDDKVVVSSDKPISEGDRVRLES